VKNITAGWQGPSQIETEAVQANPSSDSGNINCQTEYPSTIKKIPGKKSLKNSSLINELIRNGSVRRDHWPRNKEKNSNSSVTLYTNL